MIAIGDPALAERLRTYKAELEAKVEAAAKRLQQDQAKTKVN